MNPVDTEFQDMIARNSRNMREAQRGDQQYRGDWQEIREPMQYLTVQNGAGFRYGRISFVNTAVDYVKYFAKGQMLRYKQLAGSYLYCYVTDVTSTYIEIFGGSAYVLANEVVTDVAKAIVPVPSGHPIMLVYNPQLDAIGATYTPGDPAGLDYQFSMSGGQVVLSLYDLGGGSVSGACVLSTYLPVRCEKIECGFFRILNVSPRIGLHYVGNSSVGFLVPNERGVMYKDIIESPLDAGSANHMGTLLYTAA